MPGLKWEPAIRKAIRESDYFLALMSERSSTKRGFVNTEINHALEVLYEFPDDRVFLIPIRLDNCDPPSDRIRDLQYVDFFPNWKEGFARVLRVIKPVIGNSADRQTNRASRYEYRCSLLDLDNGLSNLAEICRRLNDTQGFFHFTCPPISLKHKALHVYDGVQNLVVTSLPRSLYGQKGHLNSDLVACLTRYPLAFDENGVLEYNYFSGPSSIDKTFRFLSTHLLYDFCVRAERTFEKGITHILVSQLIQFFTDISYHTETRGCVMDFCELRSLMITGLRKKRSLCSECLALIKSPSLRESVLAILRDDMIL